MSIICVVMKLLNLSIQSKIRLTKTSSHIPLIYWLMVLLNFHTGLKNGFWTLMWVKLFKSSFPGTGYYLTSLLAYFMTLSEELVVVEMEVVVGFFVGVILLVVLKWWGK